MAPPHLVETYQRRLWRITEWLKHAPGGSGFAVIISILGEHLPIGLWKFLSSSAFLGANDWFVIFSGGMLNPRTLRLKVRHVCRVGSHVLS